MKSPSLLITTALLFSSTGFLSAEEPAYDDDHPPLLKEVGAGWVTKNRVSPRSKLEVYKGEVDLLKFINENIEAANNQIRAENKIRVANGDEPLPLGELLKEGDVSPKRLELTITKQRYWMRTSNPITVANDRKHVKSFTFGTSVAALTQFETVMTATAKAGLDVGFASAGGEGSYEVRMGTQLEAKIMAQTTEEKTVFLQGGNTYVDWEQIEEISLRVTDENAKIYQEGVGSLTGKQVNEQAFGDPVQCVIHIYEDHAPTVEE